MRKELSTMRFVDLQMRMCRYVSVSVSEDSPIQSNLNGSNIFGTMEIRSRHG